MNRVSFIRQAGLGLIISFCVAAGQSLSIKFLGNGLLREWLAAAVMVYLLVIVRGTSRRGGTALAIILAAGANAVLLLWPAPWHVFLASQAGLIWLVRGSLCQDCAIARVIDLVLAAIGLAAGLVAAQQTHSLFLALWSFFLCQSLLAIVGDGTFTARRKLSPAEQFQTAWRRAHAALGRLSTSRY